MTLSVTARTAIVPPNAHARRMFLILFPSHVEELLESLLDDVGVPGYSRTQDVIGRGSRGKHFNNQIWPGATGQVFTVVDEDCAQELIDRLAAFDRELQAESRGIHGLHVLSWPCEFVF